MHTDVKESYYKTIHDLPLSKFIDCIVDGNLYALIISGDPTKEQLAEAWDFILGQYTELVGTQEYQLYKVLYCEVAVLKITLDQLRILAAKVNDQDEKVGILRIIYDEYFAKELNKLVNTNCKFNWNNQKEYHEELDKCVRRGKALKIQYDLKNLQFKAIEKKNSGTAAVKMDRQYFTSILITLSNFAKFRIDSSITMDEYCLRIKDHNDYYKEVKKQT